MTTETETAIRNCPTHGEVQATRELPRITFPPIVTSVRRTIAKRRRPYRCPTCGESVKG